MKELRLQEIKVLWYRLFLVFFFYQVSRLLFYLFNRNLIKVDGIGEYLNLAFYGIAFDITAIFYVNALFILLSLLPIFINTTRVYQKFLFYLYFITNELA